MRERAVARKLALLLAASTLVGIPARAHMMQLSNKPRLVVSVKKDQIIYEAAMPMAIFDALTNQARQHSDFITDEEREEAARLITRLFKQKNPVTIDGVRVKPVLKELEFVPPEPTPEDRATAPDDPDDGAANAEEMAELFGDDQPGEDEDDRGPEAEGLRVAGGHAKAVFTFWTKGRPGRVSIVWELFLEHGEFAITDVPATIVAFDKIEEVTLTRKEPEHVWHGPKAPVKRETLAVDRPAKGETVFVPALSLSILAGLSAFLLVARKRLSLRTRAIASVAAVAVAAATLGMGKVAVELDPPPLELPNEEEAKGMFASLHKNIYRAFDYTTEEDIYDALSQSVDGELLDDVYYEVYESLILRDQGGAVCRIDEVKILDSRMDEAEATTGDESAVAFGITCLWRVKGSVHHWGHTHTRVNEYKAQYTVEPRGGAWKITAAQVLEQRRIADTLTWDKPGGGT